MTATTGMVTKGITVKERLTDFVDMMLEDETFEEFLERFDLTPGEVFGILYEGGYVDEVLLEELM